jgi:hypothetical protein
MIDAPPPNWSIRTQVAQALGTIDSTSRALVLPISLSTTYLRDADNAYRSATPTGDRITPRSGTRRR